MIYFDKVEVEFTRFVKTWPFKRYCVGNVLRGVKGIACLNALIVIFRKGIPFIPRPLTNLRATMLMAETYFSKMSLFSQDTGIHKLWHDFEVCDIWPTFYVLFSLSEYFCKPNLRLRCKVNFKIKDADEKESFNNFLCSQSKSNLAQKCEMLE